MKRTKTVQIKTRRVQRLVVVTKQVTVLQCERPYVLFGLAVAESRRNQGITQQGLASKLSMSRGSIANIEVGRQRVLLSDVFDFAKALSIPAGRLFLAVQK